MIYTFYTEILHFSFFFFKFYILHWHFYFIILHFILLHFTLTFSILRFTLTFYISNCIYILYSIFYVFLYFTFYILHFTVDIWYLTVDIWHWHLITILYQYHWWILRLSCNLKNWHVLSEYYSLTQCGLRDPSASKNLNWILEVFENQLLHLNWQLGTLGWSLRKDLEMLAILHQQIYFIQILEDKKDSLGFFFPRILVQSFNFAPNFLSVKWLQEGK